MSSGRVSCAISFAKSGAKVVVDRDSAAGEATAGVIRQQGGEGRFVPADVTKSAGVRAYVKAALDAQWCDRLLFQQCRDRRQMGSYRRV
jgi:NAD(P)-dependent dehydrogenase (short-subunit alcohol dehydrogenase family)